MKPSLPDPKIEQASPEHSPAKVAKAPNAIAANRFITFVGILAVLFSPALIPMAIYCAGSELNSYILLIPLISGYFFNIQRPTLPAPSGSSPGWIAAISVAGVIALGGGFIWKSALSANDFYTLIALAFVFFIAAGGFFFLGRRAMLVAAFPFAFLLFLAPMPDAMADALETASKLASAEMAGIFFDLFNVPTIHDGTQFQLSDITIRVAQECSGIHSSWILLLSSLIACHLLLRSFWRRSALMIFAVVLGVVRNGFRILVLGWLCVNYGPQMIDSPIHHRGGPIFFALSLIPFFLLLWLLCRGEMKAGKLRRRVAGPNGHPPASDLHPT